jgi:hypothetical protein
MRLEPFCRITLTYEYASWHAPYGSGVDGDEALGFGHGGGAITGELDGDVLWANYPRRRQDGVWTPNVRGRIRLRDDNDVLLSMHGQSVQEDAPGHRRAILARVELTTEAEPHRWLNTSFIVGEGEIDEERVHFWMDTYVCVNELAHGPPAIGAEPPERFRQGAA